MKIKDVITYRLRTQIDEPFTSARGWWHTTREALLVEVQTEDKDLFGWGECFGPPVITKAIVDDVLKPHLIGKDPFDSNVIWEYSYNRLKDFGQNSLTMAAMSGIDIALWDIIGKACGRPIYKLIGGNFRDRLEVYATGLFFKDVTPHKLIEQSAKEALQYVNRGYRAIKMKIGLGSIEKDIYRIEKVQQVTGKDIRLMVDANHSLNLHSAIQLGRELEKLGVCWFEEPISPEDLEGYIALSRSLDIPVAGGENILSVHALKEYITRRAMDIIQPDLCAAGGITGCNKIASLAGLHWVQVMPHAFGTAVGLAATIQLLAAIPDCPPCLNPMSPMLEYEQTPNPLREKISIDPFMPKEGCIEVPDGPGLGVDIDRTSIEQYLV